LDTMHPLEPYRKPVTVTLLALGLSKVLLAFSARRSPVRPASSM
jgi:hypothetical protein